MAIVLRSLTERWCNHLRRECLPKGADNLSFWGVLLLISPNQAALLGIIICTHILQHNDTAYSTRIVYRKCMYSAAARLHCARGWAIAGWPRVRFFGVWYMRACSNTLQVKHKSFNENYRHRLQGLGRMAQLSGRGQPQLAVMINVAIIHTHKPRTNTYTHNSVTPA